MRFCARSIINSRFILTVAHCFWDGRSQGYINGTVIQIVAKTPNHLKISQYTEVLEVEENIIHPEHDYHEKINDIAILQLTSNINEEDVYAHRIKFTDGPVEAGSKCTVVGWGSIYEVQKCLSQILFRIFAICLIFL